VIIDNRVLRLPASHSAGWMTDIARLFATSLPETYPLRFGVVAVENGEAILEATAVRFTEEEPYADALRTCEIANPRPKTHQRTPFCAVQVIPTGLRCEFGGFAGDACPVTNLLAAAVDILVTHPNAVNASELNDMADNVLYVEGKSLDDFLLGHLGLRPAVSNRIGTFVDPTGLHLLDDVLLTLDAARASGGLDCDSYTVLRDDPGVEIAWTSRGCAVGLISQPDVIIEAAEALVESGAEAIGGVSVIQGVTAGLFAQHQRGEIPNPSGGVEAIITHLISKLFRLPTAHAPLPYYADLKSKTTVDPRGAAELISTPHYYSVLKGLARAPRIVELPSESSNLITLDNVAAIVVPASCLGGVPALAAELSGIPIIAVRENRTVLNVTNDHMRFENVVPVETYLEAAGVLLALREGIALPSLRRPLDRTRRITLPTPAPQATGQAQRT
jgi:Protein of unknown function (DUF3326)